MPLTRLSRAGAALLLLAAAPLTAAPKAVFADEPKYDGRYFVEVTHLLPYRDGVLGLGPGLRFMKYDSKAAETFTVAGVRLVTSAEQVAGSMLFLGLDGEGEKVGLVLAEEGAGGKDVRMIPLPRELQGSQLVDFEEEFFPCLLASSQRKALVTINAPTREFTVWWLEGKEWKSRKLPKVPKFSAEFEPQKIGGRRYLLGDTLFTGWDEGEWGGMLASIDLKDEKAQWIHLSGKKKGDTTGIPENQPVQKLHSTDGRSLWVATGLDRSNDTWSGLSSRGPDGRWSNSIRTEIKDASGPFSLPDYVSFGTAAADAQGKVYLLGLGAGIFRVEDQAIARVMDYPFTLTHDSDTSGVVCNPLDMAIAKQGDIFVSTNAFGILAFHKEGEVWKGRQILVKED